MDLTLTRRWVLSLVFAVSGPLWLSQSWAVSEQVQELQNEWAQVKYEAPNDSKAGRFEVLLKKADRFVAAAPQDLEIRVWHGIIESSYAGAAGGLGALSHVKNARKDFEAVIAAQPNTLEGSALTSLGSLYYQVPGWPLSFGSDEKAHEYLMAGLKINPNGIDPNYFYGDFLFRRKDYVGAERALRKALAAPDRPNRALADRGRRQEIETLLEQIRAKK